MSEKILEIGGGKKTFPLSNGGTVQLDPNDMNILIRLNSAMKDIDLIKNEVAKFENIDENSTQEQIDQAAEALKTMDNAMREKIDFIFDGPVSSACAGNACMFDFFDGKYRFEFIVEGLLSAYQDKITAETASMKDRIKKATPTKYLKS